MKVFNSSPKAYKQLRAPLFVILFQQNMHSIITNAILWQNFIRSFTNKLEMMTVFKVSECQKRSSD